MKIKPKQYAISLYEATKGLSEDKTRIVLVNFVKILARNNALRMAPAIVDYFVKYANRAEGIVDLKIRTAHPIKEDIVEILKKEAPSLLDKKFKKANIQKEIDANLIGGFVLESEDAVFDASVKNKFKILKNILFNK
jgi:F-type H+-transporting ATPase subunit delta